MQALKLAFARRVLGPMREIDAEISRALHSSLRC
jgi:hypothetical protein